MKFSIVTPTYNRKNKVLRSINSVLNQITEAEVEIIVVDDGSTDDTEKALQEYIIENKIQYIKLLKNSGVAEAKNTGILKATGDYLILLDSDDMLTEGALQLIKKRINNTSNLDMYFWGSQIMNSNIFMFDPSWFGEKKFEDFLVTNVGEYLPVIKTSILKKYLLKPLRSFESITWLIISRDGGSVYFDKEAIRLYDDDGDDRLTNRVNIIKNSLKLLEGQICYANELGQKLKEISKVKFYIHLLKIGFYANLTKKEDRYLFEDLKVNFFDCFLIKCFLLIPSSLLLYLYKKRQNV